MRELIQNEINLIKGGYELNFPELEISVALGVAMIGTVGGGMIAYIIEASILQGMAYGALTTIGLEIGLMASIYILVK